MEENKKILIKRILCTVAGLFFIAFGLTVNSSGFCLGDTILTALGIPVETAGIRNSTSFAVFGALSSFYFFARTTRDPKQTMQTLVFGSVGLVMVLSSILNML